MDLSTLSANKLQARHDVLSDAWGNSLKRVIAAGHGDKRMSDMHALADAGDALAQAHIAAWVAYDLVNYEMRRRMEWHGSLKPIKRAA